MVIVPLYIMVSYSIEQIISRAPVLRGGAGAEEVEPPRHAAQAKGGLGFCSKFALGGREVSVVWFMLV